MDNRTGYLFRILFFRMQISEDSALGSEPLAYSGLHFLLFLRRSVSPAVRIPAQDFYMPDGSHSYSADLFLPAVWRHPPGETSAWTPEQVFPPLVSVSHELPVLCLPLHIGFLPVLPETYQESGIVLLHHRHRLLR